MKQSKLLLRLTITGCFLVSCQQVDPSGQWTSNCSEATLPVTNEKVFVKSSIDFSEHSVSEETNYFQDVSCKNPIMKVNAESNYVASDDWNAGQQTLNSLHVFRMWTILDASLLEKANEKTDSPAGNFCRAFKLGEPLDVLNTEGCFDKFQQDRFSLLSFVISSDELFFGNVGKQINYTDGWKRSKKTPTANASEHLKSVKYGENNREQEILMVDSNPPGRSLIQQPKHLISPVNPAPLEDPSLNYFYGTSRRPATWNEANAACTQLKIGGIDGWRLPELNEITRIMLNSGLPVYLNPSEKSQKKSRLQNWQENLVHDPITKDQSELFWLLNQPEKGYGRVIKYRSVQAMSFSKTAPLNYICVKDIGSSDPVKVISKLQSAKAEKGVTL